jgi:hypothetical protein
MASLWYDAITEAAVNAAAVTLNGGTIKIYAGTAPALNAALSGQTLLATLTFSATAFATSTAASGTVTATANAITSGTAAATGTAGFCVLEDSSSGVKVVGTVGTSGANLNLSSTSIVSGALVSCSALTFTQSETGS